jgi:hypothetical protein
MPRYRRCTERTVWEILREAEARGERLDRKGLAEKVAEKCDYKIESARNLVRNAERLNWIVCYGRGDESPCRTLGEHDEDVARTLRLVLATGFDWWEMVRRSSEFYGEPLTAMELEMKVRSALTHIVTKYRRVVEGIIRWREALKRVKRDVGINVIEVEFMVTGGGREVRGEIVEELGRLGINVSGLIPTYYVLLHVAHMTYKGVNCEEINVMWGEGLKQLLEPLCEKLGGRLDRSKLGLLGDVAPMTVKVLEKLISLADVDQMVERAKERLDKEIGKLEDVIRGVLIRYGKRRQVQGCCDYCIGKVQKEDMRMVENLIEILKYRYFSKLDKPSNLTLQDQPYHRHP